VKFTTDNMPENFNLQSVRGALAVAMWAAITTELKPELAEKRLNEYTSTTTTSASTTTITTSTTTPVFDAEEAFSAEKKALVRAASREDLITAQDDAEAKVNSAKAALSADPANADLLEELQAAKKAFEEAKQELLFKLEDLSKPSASGTGDAAGGSLIPIIAGAAGGVILILIVVIVVMSGGGGGDNQQSSGGTAVVAFENPMYDDPSSNDRANPVFDEEDQGGGDEGLYDEPAFNEDGGGDGGGGYLDVQPDEESESEAEEESEASEASEEASEESESDDE